MAEGADTWASVIVLALREKDPAIKPHCILPCKTQADNGSSTSQTIYRSISERADFIVYVSREYHKTCMMERNKVLVSHSDILPAVCQGIPPSGTTATVNYARKAGKEIVIINPSAPPPFYT